MKLRTHSLRRPEKTWIEGFAKPMGISVMTVESTELARRHSCNEKETKTFFDRFSGDLNRDADLILNCHETHVSSRK
jgi:hypothetical protein